MKVKCFEVKSKGETTAMTVGDVAPSPLVVFKDEKTQSLFAIVDEACLGSKDCERNLRESSLALGKEVPAIDIIKTVAYNISYYQGRLAEELPSQPDKKAENTYAGYKVMLKYLKDAELMLYAAQEIPAMHS